MDRRSFVDRRVFVTALGASAGTPLALPLAPALADVPKADGPPMPPMDSRETFISWGERVRGEDPKYLGERFDRFRGLVANRDLTDDKDKRAFLMTPREAFVLKQNLDRAYEHAFLDIGFGVTISGPYIVGRMTQVIDVHPGDKVLEIGTGSGYQSAYLANLTDKVWTIEIIKPLAERTTAIRDELVAKGYGEFKAIQAKSADGYYGWDEAGPFDKIIVTCGIDHVPPPLLQQLKPGGVMVIPVGPPGAQHVLKIVKSQEKNGEIMVARSDIYNGRIVPFVPFTKLADDGKIEANHNKNMFTQSQGGRVGRAAAAPG